MESLSNDLLSTKKILKTKLRITAHAVKAQRSFFGILLSTTAKSSMFVRGQCSNVLDSHIDLSCYLLAAVFYFFLLSHRLPNRANSLTLGIHRTYGIA